MVLEENKLKTKSFQAIFIEYSLTKLHVQIENQSLLRLRKFDKNYLEKFQEVSILLFIGNRKVFETSKVNEKLHLECVYK